MAWSLTLRGVGSARHAGFEGRLDARLELRSGALTRELDGRATVVRDGFVQRDEALARRGRIGLASADTYVAQYLGGGSHRPRVVPLAWRASEDSADVVGGVVARDDVRSPYSDTLTTALRADFSGYDGDRRPADAYDTVAHRLLDPLLKQHGRLAEIPDETFTTATMAWVHELGVTNIILHNFHHYLNNLLSLVVSAHYMFLELHEPDEDAEPSHTEHQWTLFGRFIRTDGDWTEAVEYTAVRYGEVLDLFANRKDDFAQALTGLRVPYGIHRELIALSNRGEEWGPVLARAFDEKKKVQATDPSES